VSGPEIQSEGSGWTAGQAAGPRASEEILRQVLGVFAGTGRGTRIGAAVGTCGCFLVMMASAIFDSVTRGDGGMPLGATLFGWVFVAVWFLVVSPMLGGAVLGAMVGAFFPVRRRR